jgi:hypothetical protein
LAAAFLPAVRCFLVAAAFFAVALRFVAFFMEGSISGRAIVALMLGHYSDCLFRARRGPGKLGLQESCKRYLVLSLAVSAAPRRLPGGARVLESGPRPATFR